jgi:pimeloyl-ACP methyl ester carboxylesterase
VLSGTLSIASVLSPRLTGRWLFHLWRRTHRFAEPSREARWRQQAREMTVPWQPDALRLYCWGSGPTVLLLHGWNGRGTQLGALAAPLARAGYRAVALDAPGHGRSPGDSSSLFEFVAALERTAAHIGSCHAVIAHSLGAMAVVRALRQGFAPGRVVCIAPPARMDYLIEGFCRIVGAPRRARRELTRLLAERFDGHLGDTVAADLSAAPHPVPGLVIHDEEDREVPWQQGEAIARAWPGAQFVLTRGLGHNRILRDGAVIRAAVDFVTDGTLRDLQPDPQRTDIQTLR